MAKIKKHFCSLFIVASIFIHLGIAYYSSGVKKSSRSMKYRTGYEYKEEEDDGGALGARSSGDIDYSHKQGSNRRTLIKCDKLNPPTAAPEETTRHRRAKSSKVETSPLVSPSQFYQSRSRCWHNFKSTTTFFHVGKAGGGTITHELRRAHIGIAMTHPHPNPKRLAELQYGPSHTLIINVRDPIDRFISAFNWRLAVLCSPNDTRKAGKRGAAQDPHGQCKTSKEMKVEERMLREKYNGSPNDLAEALCEEDSRYEEAIVDYDSILHSMKLSTWLEFLIDPKLQEKIHEEDGIQHFIALPLEKRDENNGESLFEEHIQQLTRHLLHTKYGNETSREIMEHASRIDKAGGGKGKEIWEHSSVKFNSNSTGSSDSVGQTVTTLSPLGACCLARHLEQDYRLIRTMLGADDDVQSKNNKKKDKSNNGKVQPLDDVHPVISRACTWGSLQQQKSCRDDLQSMITRRERYLDRSMGSCSSVASNR